MGGWVWQCRAERAQGITEMVLIRSIRALSCATSCGARSHRAYWVGEAEDLRGEAWGSRIGMHIHGSEAQVSMEAAAGAGRGGQSHAGKQNDARAVLTGRVSVGSHRSGRPRPSVLRESDCRLDCGRATGPMWPCGVSAESYRMARMSRRGRGAG